MLVAPTPGLVLPDYARPDLSFVQTVVVPYLGANTTASFVVPGDFISVPFNVSISYTASAAGASRIPVVEVFDPDLRFIYGMPASINLPPNGAASYVWTTSISAGYFDVAQSFNIVPLPELALLPLWRLNFAVEGADVADVCSAVKIVVLQIPTGPSGTPEAPAGIVATPLVA